MTALRDLGQVSSQMYQLSCDVGVIQWSVRSWCSRGTCLCQDRILPVGSYWVMRLGAMDHNWNEGTSLFQFSPVCWSLCCGWIYPGSGSLPWSSQQWKLRHMGGDTGTAFKEVIHRRGNSSSRFPVMHCNIVRKSCFLLSSLTAFLCGQWSWGWKSYFLGHLLSCKCGP